AVLSVSDPVDSHIAGVENAAAVGVGAVVPHDAVVDSQRAMVVNTGAPTLRYVSANGGIVYRERRRVVLTRAVSGKAMADRELGKSDMGCPVRDGNNRVDASSINNRCAGTRADEG